MASDQNEKHEENESTEFKHSDGWGIIYKNNNQLQIYKSVKPCYEDETLSNFVSLQSPFIALHARRASTGRVTFKNVHPFIDKLNGQPFAFCHNGTVHDDLNTSEKYYPKGEVDSERFFYFILTHLDDDPVASYKKVLKAIISYTSMNSFLCSKDQSLIVNQYTLNPLYYTMKISQDDESIIISSEVLPNMLNRHWSVLKNGSFIRIDHSNDSPIIEISSLSK